MYTWNPLKMHGHMNGVKCVACRINGIEFIFSYGVLESQTVPMDEEKEICIMIFFVFEVLRNIWT
jgi:hypothetical protein